MTKFTSATNFTANCGHEIQIGDACFHFQEIDPATGVGTIKTKCAECAKNVGSPTLHPPAKTPGAIISPVVQAEPAEPVEPLPVAVIEPAVAVERPAVSAKAASPGFVTRTEFYAVAMVNFIALGVMFGMMMNGGNGQGGQSVRSLSFYEQQQLSNQEEANRIMQDAADNQEEEIMRRRIKEPLETFMRSTNQGYDPWSGRPYRYSGS